MQIDSDNQCDPKYLIEICHIINKKIMNLYLAIDQKAGWICKNNIIKNFEQQYFKKFTFIPDLNSPIEL